MEFVSVSEYAQQHGIAERTVRNWCAAGKIEGVVLVGKTWNIPADAAIPVKGKIKVSPLLKRLREEKEGGIKGGIYHRTQIDLTYNSNHIEGSRLTHEQTRFIFETNTIGITDKSVNVDDILETTNHFRCIDLIIDRAHEKLSEAMIKELHRILKSGTSDSRKEWFAIGDYKRFPNEVGGCPTVAPKDVPGAMKELLRDYHAKKEKSLEDLLDFHCRFERIHPFQDGNGRIGRLLLFKECLGADLVPFIITDDLKEQYYFGIQNWDTEPEILIDTCTLAQRRFLQVMADYWIVPNNWPEF